ncbi:nitroreductase/quinone reductase family protein [Amycolatopsis sp. NPDC051071]|uniref:nitroreductase/quinone reductase family protein n=1 Tax=Amycolatopsis sp. NPDC051071 TaxID=3154637 RepID=UPI0034486D35
MDGQTHQPPKITEPSGELMIDLQAMNERVIAEFRANGRRGDGLPTLLLTTTGVRTGRRHVTPMLFLADDDRYVVFAANGGAPGHPHWYRNLISEPSVDVEADGEAFTAHAEEITGAARDRLFAKQAKAFPRLAEHQSKTSRPFPVVALKRV